MKKLFKKMSAALLAVICVITVLSPISALAVPRKVNIKSITSKPNGYYVTWEKIPDLKGGYLIETATRSDFSNSVIESTFQVNDSYEDFMRAPNTWYYVRVCAWDNEFGPHGTWSDPVRVKTGSKTNPESTYIKRLIARPSGFELELKKVYTADYYQIKFATRKDMANAAVTTIGPNETISTILGRAQNCTYYVQVRTVSEVNGQKYYSRYSAIKQVKTRPANEPYSVTMIPNGFESTSTTATLAWFTHPTAQEYNVKYSTTRDSRGELTNAKYIRIVGTDSYGCVMQNLSPNTTYYVQVRSTRNGVCAPWSAIFSIKTTR